ncbi:hypothetical protein TNCV_2816041 [Trichonephila clavipes]|nr:hypothetical protein TNCV_2816041 [Trichonephila clavipes]
MAIGGPASFDPRTFTGQWTGVGDHLSISTDREKADRGEAPHSLSFGIILMENNRDVITGDHGSLVAKATDSWPTCHEFEHSTAEDSSYTERTNAR